MRNLLINFNFRINIMKYYHNNHFLKVGLEELLELSSNQVIIFLFYSNIFLFISRNALLYIFYRIRKHKVIKIFLMFQHPLIMIQKYTFKDSLNSCFLLLLSFCLFVFFNRFYHIFLHLSKRYHLLMVLSINKLLIHYFPFLFL